MRLILSLLILSSNVLANDNLCLKLRTIEGQVGCKKLTLRYDFKPRLTNYCINNTRYDDQAIECLTYQINKTYTDEESNFCLKAKNYQCLNEMGSFSNNLKEISTCFYSYENKVDDLEYKIDRMWKRDIKGTSIAWTIFPLGLSFSGSRIKWKVESFQLSKVKNLIYSARVKKNDYEFYSFAETILDQTTLAINHENVRAIIEELDDRQAFCSSSQLSHYSHFKELIMDEIIAMEQEEGI